MQKIQAKNKKFFYLCGCNPMTCLHAIYGNADGALDQQLTGGNFLHFYSFFISLEQRAAMVCISLALIDSFRMVIYINHYHNDFSHICAAIGIMLPRWNAPLFVLFRDGHQDPQLSLFVLSVRSFPDCNVAFFVLQSWENEREAL